MTHRQYLSWQAWLDDQWNRPDRHDHYLMRIAMEVVRAAAKNPEQVQFSQFKIPFVTGGESKPRMSVEQATAVARAAWAMRLGKV